MVDYYAILVCVLCFRFGYVEKKKDTYYSQVNIQHGGGKKQVYQSTNSFSKVQQIYLGITEKDDNSLEMANKKNGNFKLRYKDKIKFFTLKNFVVIK